MVGGQASTLNLKPMPSLFSTSSPIFFFPIFDFSESKSYRIEEESEEQLTHRSSCEEAEEESYHIIASSPYPPERKEGRWIDSHLLLLYCRVDFWQRPRGKSKALLLVLANFFHPSPIQAAAISIRGTERIQATQSRILYS